ncbi:heat shock protein 30 [Lasiosphaeria ovina]|uniref:Heat shock protein 30 n=1 Tax=Lasiosphaeria ovina TaxID=92902 RepID=A0AAE0N5R7_9PEZI|nr:heat shock protein 30 [Lasiosphaeria ovina]
MAVISISTRENDALDINPPAGDQFLNVNGSDWLWAVTALFVVSFLTLYGLTLKARAGERFFHFIFIIATFVGSIAYFAMASDLGWSLVPQANSVASHGLLRQIFFAKYIYWVVSFPAAVIALGVLSGVSWASIVFNVFLSWIWVLSYLVGAYTTTNYKWGFFAFGTVAYLFLAVNTLLLGRRSAARVGVAGHYTGLTAWLNLLWLLYPIAYGISDGGNRIGVVGGFVFFGVLDLLMIPVLAFAVVFLSAKWDYSSLNIAFTQYGRVHATPGTFPEKHPVAAAPAAAPAAPAPVAAV